MNNQLTEAVLLLCSHFDRPKKDGVKPLTPTEYGRFAVWLHENGYKPDSLFTEFEEILSKWKDDKFKITKERINGLLNRGMQMGIALEKWHSAGIWILTRSDDDYPKRLKRKLGKACPPLLYGVGNKSLLNVGGLSIVGSRNIDALDYDFTQKVAQQASLEGLNVVSGGARGVDEVSMLSALESEGSAIGVLADSLYKAALSSKWRKYIKQQQLVLVSAYYPEAGFNAGNAMGRNKYIYALSDFALIVRSDKGKGGTWAGAVENLKKSWVPSFINSDNFVDGNLALIDMGAKPFSIIDTRLDKNWLANKLYYIDLPGTVIEPEKHSNQERNQKFQKLIVEETETPELINNIETQTILDEIESETLLCSESIFSRKDLFYETFKEYLNMLLLDSPNVSFKELEELTPDVKKIQITSWLERAEDEGVIERIGRARSYKKPSQLDLGRNATI